MLSPKTHPGTFLREDSPHMWTTHTWVVNIPGWGRGGSRADYSVAGENLGMVKRGKRGSCDCFRQVRRWQSNDWSRDIGIVRNGWIDKFEFNFVLRCPGDKKGTARKILIQSNRQMGEELLALPRRSYSINTPHFNNVCFVMKNLPPGARLSAR